MSSALKKEPQLKALRPKEPKSWQQYHIGRNQRKDRKQARQRQ
jgi:hypothetical protein